MSGLRQSLSQLLQPLLERARREPRRRRAAWLVTALVFVAVPLSVNLARESDFETSIEIFPRAVGPYPAVSDAAYYRAFLDDPGLRARMEVNVGRNVASYKDVTIRRGPRRGALTVTVTARTPTDAERFANALAAQLAGASGRDVARLAAADADAVRDRLRGRLSTRERAILRRRFRRLERLAEPPRPRAVPGRAAPRPRLTSAADRAVDSLPGSFSGRPNPILAALAGLLVVAIAWATCLVLVPPPRGGT